MTTLTYAELELLQHTLFLYMKDNTNHKDYLDSLYTKLITMREQLEEQIINTL